MFDRAAFKTYAKNVLRKTYWMSFAVCLIGGFLVGFSQGGLSGFNSYIRIQTNSYTDVSMYEANPELFAIMMYILFVIFIFTIVFNIFVSGPVTTGLFDFFIKA